MRYHCWSLRETIEELEHIASQHYADEWETGIVWVEVDKDKRSLAFERCTDEALAQTHYDVGKSDGYDAGYDMCADEKVTPWLDELSEWLEDVLEAPAAGYPAAKVIAHLTVEIQRLRDML